MNNVQHKVFLSYSWKDMPMAMRLYNDLVHSQVSVWRDQIDGNPIADFKEEFLSKIDECDYFLMLDSINYRQKSNWCCTEVERCLKKRKKIIVCLLDPDGPWRTEYRNSTFEKLFSQINMLKYHSLYFEDYDNDKEYYKTVSFICSLLQLEYRAWNQFPTTQDLLDEMSVSPLTNDADRKMILSEYDVILHLTEENRDNVREHFKLWIDDCEECGASLFFPRWTYAVWLAQERHNGKYDEECLSQFKYLTELYPEEPRAFRGLGCIAAQMHQYEYAYKQLCIAYQLLNKDKHVRQKRFTEFEVLINIGQICMNLSDFNNAYVYLEKAQLLMQEYEQCNISLLLNIDYCMHAMDYPLGLRIDNLKNNLEIYPLEAELYSALGLCYTEKGEDELALDLFTKAFELQPNMQTLFYALCRKKFLNRTLSHDEIRIELDKECVNEEEYYWKGAIWYYIMNDLNCARECYTHCDSDIYEWYN